MSQPPLLLLQSIRRCCSGLRSLREAQNREEEEEKEKEEEQEEEEEEEPSDLGSSLVERKKLRGADTDRSKAGEAQALNSLISWPKDQII